MVVQVGSLGQLHHNPADTLAPWRCHDRISSLDDDDDTEICCNDAQMVHNIELTRLRLHTPSSGSPSGYQPEESKSPPTSPTSPPRVTSTEPPHTTSSLPRPQQPPPSLKPRPGSPDQASPLPSPTPTPSPLLLSQPGQKLSQKRRRPLNDVDGPDTASLGCKKRRLRLHLITSRLSRPFSVPATHILNREAIANYPGEGRRFAKLAKYLVARRAAVSVPAQASAHNPSSVDLLRRAAIHNRLIIRMRSNGQILYAQQQITGGVGMAAVAHHGMALMSAAKFFFPSPAPSSPAQPPPPPQHQNHVSMQQWHHHHTPNHVHAAPGPASVTQHYGAMLPIIPPPATETPAPPIRRRDLEYNHARLPPSPKLKAVGSAGNSRRRGPSHSPLSESPEFRPARERDFDDDDEVDDDAVSFPTNEIESRFGDSDNEEDGDGYDFSVIFGGPGPGGNDTLTPDELDELEFGMLDDQPTEHFYEEYLEELDGIPWRA